jgi:hypothetical protein
MRKINWKQVNSDIRAQVGCINLNCFSYYSKWYAFVYCDVDGFQSKCGPYRKSLSKVKEDAVKIACEMLCDFQAALDIEKKNFDL